MAASSTAPPTSAASPAMRSRRLDRTDWWFLFAMATFVEVLVFLDLNETFFWINNKGDSAVWIEQSQEALTSRAFWAKVPLYPLVIRIFGSGSGLHIFQVVLSAVAFFWLAYEVMRLVRNRWWGYALFVFVVVSSRNGAVQVVNHIVISEGVAFSLSAMVVALVLHLTRRPSRLGWISLGAVVLFFTFSRPSSFMVLLLGVVVVGFVAWRLPEQRKVFGSLAVAGLSIFALLVLLNRGQGEESNNLYNIIPEWILTDDQALAWFEDAGMPAGPAVLALAGKELDADDPELRVGPLDEWSAWVDAEGGSAYVRFLATHPLWVTDKYADAQGDLYISTLSDVNELLDEGTRAAQDFTVRGTQAGRLMSPARTFANPLYPDTGAWLLLWLVGVGVGSVWAIREGVERPAWVLFGFAMVATAPILAVPIVLGDSQEIARHAVGIALQLRWGLLLITAWLGDEALARRAAGQRPSS